MPHLGVLRYLHDGALRDRVHLQLNRGESRHALTDRLCFGNQGESADPDMARQAARRARTWRERPIAGAIA